MATVKQCKGKDLDKVPKSKLIKEGWYASVKFDGTFIRLERDVDGNCRMFTRTKEFYCPNLAKIMDELGGVFKLDCEYIGDSKGKLGDRVKANLGTHIANFRKGIRDVDLIGRVLIFDIVSNRPFKDRLLDLSTDRIYGRDGLKVTFVFHDYVDTLERATEVSEETINEGYEGIYIKHKDHMYLEGKRVNDAIKIKAKPTIDCICVEVEKGKGKYKGMLGALVLEYKGNRFNVGTGFTDKQREKNKKKHWVGKTIEIGYEQIIKDVPIHPVFKYIREDK